MEINRITRVSVLSPVETSLYSLNKNKRKTIEQENTNEIPNRFRSDEIAKYFFREIPNGRPIYNNEDSLEIYNESKEIQLNPHATFESKHLQSILVNTGLLPKNGKKIEDPKIRVFISDDGDKLRFLANQKTNGKPSFNEIVVYIEGDNDVLSKRFFKILVGPKITLANELVKTIMLNCLIGLDEKTVDEIIKNKESWGVEENSFLADQYHKAVNFINEYWPKEISISALIEWLEGCKVKPEVWAQRRDNPTSEYFNMLSQLSEDAKTTCGSLNELADKMENNIADVPVLNKFKYMIRFANMLVTTLSQFILYATAAFTTFIFAFAAAVMGFINGVIDLICGFLFLIDLGVKAAFLTIDVSVMIGEKALNYSQKQQVFEQIDNIVDALMAIDFNEVTNSIRNDFTKFLAEIDFEKIMNFLKEKTKKAVQKVFSLETIFYIGFGIGYAVTFFIPIGAIYNVIAKAGKVGVAVVKYLRFVDSIFEAIFGVAIKGLKKSMSAFSTLMRAFYEKIKKGTPAVKEVTKKIFDALREFLTAIMPDWKMAGIILTSFGLMSFTNVEASALQVILGTLATTSIMKIVRLLITKLKVAFGEHIAENGKKLYAVFHNEIPVFQGTIDDLAAFLKKLDDAPNLEKYLEELAERVKGRQQALVEFNEKIGKDVVENLKKHINGVIELIETSKNSKGQPIYRGKATGIHNYYEYIIGKIRFREGKLTIPPNPQFDEPFIAFVQKYSEITKMWYNKTNSSLKNLAGKGDKSMTSMFPKNWGEQRIIEEIAFAWKNMTKVGFKTENGKLIEAYIGKSTTGFDIEFIFTDKVLSTAAPKIIL